MGSRRLTANAVWIDAKFLPVSNRAEDCPVVLQSADSTFEVECGLGQVFALGSPLDPSGQPLFTRLSAFVVVRELIAEGLVPLDDATIQELTALDKLNDTFAIGVVRAPDEVRADQDARRRVLRRQQNRCLHCQLDFGSWAYRSSFEVEKLRPCYTGRVPASARARDGVAGVCQICLEIASALVFPTLDDCRSLVIARRTARGWRATGRVL
jgi:hypothetical protein